MSPTSKDSTQLDEAYSSRQSPMRMKASTTVVVSMEEGRPAVVSTSASASASTNTIKSRVLLTSQSFTQSDCMHCCEFGLDRLSKDNQEIECYKDDYPLLFSMLLHQDKRTKRLQKEGTKQIDYPAQNYHGWFQTLWIAEGRALGNLWAPWCLVVLHAIAYTVVHRYTTNWASTATQELRSWETFFGVALNATLSLLLVFRLNRAAARWWLARQFWGKLIAKSRTIVSGILLHTPVPAAPAATSNTSVTHKTTHPRDEAIRWTAAFCVTSMEFLRGCPELHDDLLAGILTPAQMRLLEQQAHPPLFVAQQIRYYMRQALLGSSGTSSSIRGSAESSTTSKFSDANDVATLTETIARTQQLATLEQEWSVMLDQCGAMERIRATPLPIVYVSHLRTFLLLALLLYPYVWGAQWKWSTIPIVALAAFAMLGIEAASIEVEQPFKKDRVNALNMDGFCIGTHSNIIQLLRQEADREISQKQA